MSLDRHIHPDVRANLQTVGFVVLIKNIWYASFFPLHIAQFWENPLRLKANLLVCFGRLPISRHAKKGEMSPLTSACLLSLLSLCSWFRLSDFK